MPWIVTGALTLDPGAKMWSPISIISACVPTFTVSERMLFVSSDSFTSSFISALTMSVWSPVVPGVQLNSAFRLSPVARDMRLTVSIMTPSTVSDTLKSAAVSKPVFLIVAFTRLSTSTSRSDDVSIAVTVRSGSVDTVSSKHIILPFFTLKSLLLAITGERPPCS